MASSVMHEKISIAEAQQWMFNSYEHWTGKSIDALDTADLDKLKADFLTMRPVDFKAPRKPRVSKTSSDPAERSALPYNPDLCNARIWSGPSIGGFGVQCTCKADELCTRHTTEASKNGGMVKNGFFNGERPTHHYGDTSKKFIPWHDVLDQLPAKKPKADKQSSGSTQARKCSVCGEFGHNKRKCPHASSSVDTHSMDIAKLEAALAKAKEAQAKTDASSVSETPAEVTETPTEVTETVTQVTETVTDVSEPAQLDEDHNDLSAAGVGLPAEEQSPSDLELDEGEREADTITSYDCTFEGVPYTRNADNVVLDDDFDVVGSWDGEKIVFTDAQMKKQHRLQVAAL